MQAVQILTTTCAIHDAWKWPARTASGRGICNCTRSEIEI